MIRIAASGPESKVEIRRELLYTTMLPLPGVAGDPEYKGEGGNHRPDMPELPGPRGHVTGNGAYTNIGKTKEEVRSLNDEEVGISF